MVIEKNVLLNRYKILTFLSFTVLPSAGLAKFASKDVQQGQISSTHVYHNHMPNFWPWYDVSDYNDLPVGSPIRYTYDGQVIQIKQNSNLPSSWPRLPNGQPMPHDPLASGGGYYSHHAKYGAYQLWPWDQTNRHYQDFPLSQTHVTMSASVINNVHSLNTLPVIDQYYNNPNWGGPWRDTWENLKTPQGYRTLDLIHFTGHHTMGPLVGNRYFLKELIYHNMTLAQDYFLGKNYRSSFGFFPTELGFSTRLIPVLKKMGIQWSVIGNNHFSRTLKDYPYLNDPGIDTMVSPPNRADLRNQSSKGSWVSQPMFNEKQVVQNKFPFASIPHWVSQVDPETGEEQKIAGIPVAQAESWEEGYQGQVTARDLKPFISDAQALNRTQYFVIAHDGDNSSGRAGSEETWRNGWDVTYRDGDTIGQGVDEYLATHPIPEDDIVHVQDGSWIDTRDSSSDPSWYHWHLPFGIWQGQRWDFEQATGLKILTKKNHLGQNIGHMVSLEHGYHYLERNFALLQAAENYAATAEQIWLDGHPNYWQPETSLDKQVTYDGNQLNPWMLSYPVKGDPNNDYAGGANPAELAWYFLIPALDSGFGYYDENQDDHVKPTIAFNQSIHFSKPYVTANLKDDKTPPSIWWPQRYPYNPGSANVGKAEGWTLTYHSQKFALYTYGFDASGIRSVTAKIRVHNQSEINNRDHTYKVYDPEKLKNKPGIDPARVGDWRSIAMDKRSLQKDINGVPWQAKSTEVMQIVAAKEIGDLYYTYIDSYQDQYLDYYIEAIDEKGNVSKSDIQTVYIGSGQFTQKGNKIVEDPNGEIEGVDPFVVIKNK